MKCPTDTDKLIAMEELFQWQGRETVRHMEGCSDCGELLEDLERLREALRTTVRPRPGATNEVMEQVRDPSRTRERRLRPQLTLLPVFTFCLATVTALATLMILSMGTPDIAGSVPAALVLSMLFGVGAVRRLTRTSAKESPDLFG